MMAQDTPSPQAQESLSSKLMVESLRYNAIVELGRKLVGELGLDQTVDTLGRWMAHYIAGLISEAEAADAESKSEKMSKCASAILELWSHRSEMPEGKRPFGSVEPIMRALESLDPDKTKPRYFRMQRDLAETSELPPETKHWLKTVESLDGSAKNLIRFCLANAAKSNSDKSKDWIAIAEALGGDEGIDLIVARFVNKETELLNSSSPEGSEREEIAERLEDLNEFIACARHLANVLVNQLDNSEGIPAKVLAPCIK